MKSRFGYFLVGVCLCLLAPQLFALFPRTVQVALPMPHATHIKPQTLSLQEAILLALRNNPDVENAELQRVIDKFALVVARNEFELQYQLTGQMSFAHGNQPSYQLNPQVSLKTPIGTSFQVAYNRTFTGGIGQTTYTVTQPLIQNFGLAVNMVNLRNAYDNELIAQLNYKNSIIQAVVNVINNYRSLVEDYNNIQNQEESLKLTEETLRQYKLKVKEGQLAPSEVNQEQASLDQAKLGLLQSRNTLEQNYQDFLKTLGLAPTARLKIDTKIIIGKQVLPNLQQTIALALKNNIAYRQAVIQLRATKRAIITAQNGLRWTLNLTLQTQTGTNTSDIFQAQQTGPTGMPQATFNLTIPIDDVSAQQSWVNAKVAYQQAINTLEQTKLDLIRRIITEVHTIDTQYQQIQIGNEQVRLQVENLKAAQIRQRYGRATAFDVVQQQTLLLANANNLVADQIGYLNSVTTLNQDLAITLQKYHIKLRY